MTIRFTASTWLHGADEVSDIARRGSVRAAHAIEGTVAASGPSVIDQSIHEHLVRLRAEASAAVWHWERTLNDEADRMHSTGVNYQMCEEANEALARRLEAP